VELRFTVINQSHVPLENVVLSGSGFSEAIGSVPPNAQLRVLVRPHGESGLEIGFNAGGRSVSYGPEGYFEEGGGYTVIAIVSAMNTTVRAVSGCYGADEACQRACGDYQRPQHCGIDSRRRIAATTTCPLRDV
jgi:hypothetical protein